jgi:hypothetical protein
MLHWIENRPMEFLRTTRLGESHRFFGTSSVQIRYKPGTIQEVRNRRFAVATIASSNAKASKRTHCQLAIESTNRRPGILTRKPT